MDTSQSQDPILTAREAEVLMLVANGCKNREIAQALEIKERTVRFHIEHILRKLKLKNRSEARCYACKQGWLHE